MEILSDTDKQNYTLLIDKALLLLSLRPRTEHEISLKLRELAGKKGIGTRITDLVLQDLRARGLLNDLDFANWWIDQRETFRPKGERLLKAELRRKGVSEIVINESFEKRQHEGKGDFVLALELAQKRLSRLPSLSERELRHKLGTFLARRGFNWEVVSSVIAKVLRKE